MTNLRAMQLLMIERTCVRMGSGYDWSPKGYVKVTNGCNRDCANCALVQDAKELLEMYDIVIDRMIKEVKEDEKREQQELKDWQRECYYEPPRVLAI